jgi:hypothetical protein
MTPRPDKSTWSEIFPDEFGTGEVNPLDLERIQKGQHNVMEDFITQMNMKKRGYTGTNMKEPSNHDFDNATTTVTFKPELFRSPLAHFNPKYAGIGGAGAILSTNLMASPNDIDLAQGIHDRANERRQGPSPDEMITKLNQKRTEDLYDYSQDNYLGNYVPGTNKPYLRGGRDSQDYSYGGQLGIPNSPEALAQQRFYNEHTYPGMAGVRGIGDTLNSIVDKEKELIADSPKEYTGISWLDRNPMLDEGERGTGVAEFLIGEGGDFFDTLGNSQETTGTQQLDAGMLFVDLLSGGSTKVARKFGQTLYDTLDGTYINKGFDKLEDIGGKIADFGGDVLEAGKSGAMVVGKGVDDALRATFPPGGGGTPQLAPANATIESLVKDIEKPKPTRQEPLKADIPLDDTGLNPVTGVQVVAPRVASDFLDEVNNAVKEKEKQLDRPLTEDEMADVRDNVTFDRYKDKDFRVADGLKEDEVLRLNSEGRLVKQIVDKTETKDIFELLPRKSNTLSNDGVVLANDFKDRPIGDNPWELVFEEGPVGTEIKLSDAIANGATEEQVGKSLLDKTKINEVFPAIPKDMANSKNPQEVADFFRETYRGHNGTGMASIYQSAKGRQNIQLNRNVEVVNAVADMRRLDIEDGGSRLKPTIQEIEDKINFNLRSGWLSLADGDTPITSIKQLKEEVSEKQFAGIMHKLTHHAKSDVLRNNLAKHLDNNPQLRNKPVPGDDLDPLSKQTNFEIDGVPVGKIIQKLDTQLNDKLKDIADKAGITTGEELTDSIKVRQLRSLFRKYADLVNSGQVDEANKVINSPKLYPHLQNMKSQADKYVKEAKAVNQQIINAGQGLDPVTGNRPKKLSINKPTAMHEIEGHLTQEAHGMHHGGQSSQWVADIMDVQSLLENKMFLRDGSHGLQVRNLDLSSESQRRYMNMKGEVSARKSEANATKVTADNIHEPKSASDYKEPQTLDADGNWVNEKFPSLHHKDANTNVSLEQSRINPSMDNYIGRIIAEMEGIDDVSRLEAVRLNKNARHKKSIKENADLIGGTGPRSSRVNLGRATEDAIKYDDEGKEILKPKGGITNEFIKSISDEQAKLEGKASSAYRAGQGLNGDDPSIILSNKKPTLEELDNPNLNKKWQGENTSEGNPAYDASSSEVKNWNRNKSTKDGQDKDLAGTFNDANVKQRDINPVDNIESLVSRIQNPAYLKHIKRARSAKDDYQATDDELITNLVRSLSEIENNVVTGNNKARQLKAKDNTIDYINRVILDIQNRQPYRRNAGAKKEYQPKAYDDRKLKGINDTVIDDTNAQKSITPGYEFTETGGLLKPQEVDLSQHIGDEIIPMPYDATSRGNQLNKVNDLDLDVITHGGDEHMDAVNNIEAKIAGASSKSIVDKIVKRIKSAGLRSEARGGTGQVLVATNTMGDMAEGFSKAPAMSAIQVVSQGKAGARKLFNKEFRNMSSSKAKLTDAKTGAIANILNDDSFKEAMDDLVKMHLDMLINSDVDDKTAREVCYIRITTINEIMAHLQSIADQEKIDNKRWKI